MHSIRTKIIALTLAAILASVLGVGVISVLSVKGEGDRSSEQEMTLICENLEKSIDEYLNSIEQSVDMISRYAGEELSNTELVDAGVVGSQANSLIPDPKRTTAQQEQLDAYLSEHESKVETVLRSVANHTNGIVAYYYRLNPALSEEVKGFFYTKEANAAFVSQTLTDLGSYEPGDVNHVGWFYIPLERGRPSWLSPYYNENIDVKMASYVTPIYKAGTFIGVIGMDISYDTLVSQVEHARIYTSGYACLLEQDGTVIYHPNIEDGSNLADAYPDNAESIIQNLRRSKSSALLPFRSADGVEKRIAFSTLSNDMKLIVVAPVREINAAWTRLINVMVLTTLCILALFLGLMAFTMTHITEPLRRLTEASKRISAGDYDVELEYQGKDELGILTQSFQQLINHLKIYIKDLNSRAYRDSLTGVKNKGAYVISERKLNDSLRSLPPEEREQFAIVMLDCNGLKEINDRYGHDKGDIYLRTACTLICKVFAHSPVFRMGGDEFVAILQKDDFLRREELIHLFHERSEEINEEHENQWERIDIALGMAEYDSKTDQSVESVLHRADTLMYEDKRRKKQTVR